MVLVPNWLFFQLFFFWQYRPGNVFYYLLDQKNAFVGYKKTEVQKVEKLTFFQRV